MLAKYEDIKQKAHMNYQRVQDGSSLADNTNPWRDEWLHLFKRWIDYGSVPSRFLGFALGESCCDSIAIGRLLLLQIPRVLKIPQSVRAPRQLLIKQKCKIMAAV